MSDDASSRPTNPAAPSAHRTPTRPAPEAVGPTPQDCLPNITAADPVAPTEGQLPRPLRAVQWMFWAAKWKNILGAGVAWLWWARYSSIVLDRAKDSGGMVDVLVMLFFVVIPFTIYAAPAAVLNGVMVRSISRAASRARLGYTAFAALFLMFFAVTVIPRIMLSIGDTRPSHSQTPSTGPTGVGLSDVVFFGLLLFPVVWTIVALCLLWHSDSKRFYAAGLAVRGGPSWGRLLAIVGASKVAIVIRAAMPASRSTSRGNTNPIAGETPPNRQG